MPILILLVLLPMQFALWWHANQAAEVAAEQAVQAAVTLNANPDLAAADGVNSILGHAGNLENVAVNIDRTDTTITVRVTGDLAFSLFGTMSVSAQASGAIERFVPEDERT